MVLLQNAAFNVSILWTGNPRWWPENGKSFNVNGHFSGNIVSLCFKKTPTQTFVHICANCEPIYKISARLVSAVSVQQSNHYRSHRTKNTSLHYRVKYWFWKILWNTMFKKRTLLFYSLFQQIIVRFLTDANTKIPQSLLITNVIICNQSVRFFLEHKPEVACATVWWRNQWRTGGGDCTIHQCALTTRLHLEC